MGLWCSFRGNLIVCDSNNEVRLGNLFPLLIKLLRLTYSSLLLFLVCFL